MGIRMIKDKNFYKQFLKICIVLVMQNVLTLSVNLADNVMLGNYSESALSGATAVNQIQFVFQQMILGVGDALVIFGSQYWGKKQTAEIKRIASVAMISGVVVITTFFMTATFAPTFLMKLFTNDALIIAEGVKYIGITRFTYIFLGIVLILLATLRTVEIVKIAFVLSASTLVINCSINWVLIAGRYGFPELGIIGAGIGTITARIIELIILIVFIMKKDNILKLRLKDFFVIDRGLAKTYYKLLWPVLFAAILWGVNTAMQTAILGHMSSNAIAANSVAANLFLLVKTGAIGAASTTTIMIGKAIGEGRSSQLQSYANTFQKMFLMIGVVCSIVLMMLVQPVLSLYSLSEETRYLAQQFLVILSVTMFFMSYQMPTNIGIIRGAGDTKYMMYLDTISICLIVLPLAFFMAFVVEASPVIVVICLNIDQVFKCIPAYVKVNHGKWIHKLVE
ncbi:MAG: MATE family efflux transporter [Eubacteriales bacterium]